MGSERLLAAAAVPVLVAVAVYLPALRNGFIWDDPIVLRQMAAIRSAGDLLVPPPIIPKYYFRPVIFLSYLVDQALGGGAPSWFHLSVVAFHALNTLLVFVLAHRLFPVHWLAASGGALLFAVYPTHVESVAWMAGRSDVLVCTFVLLTVLLFLRRDRRWSSWLGGATFLLALLSKEMAVACAVVVPSLDLLHTRRLQWARYPPLLLALVVYLALRQRALGAIVGGIPTGDPPGTVGLDVLRALGFYVVRAVVPAPLCAYMPEVPEAPVYLLVGLLVPLVSLGFVVTAWRRERHRLGDEAGDLSNVSFLIAWFFVTLAPSLTVIVRRSASAVVADRYLYVPSVASCVLLSWAVLRLTQTYRLATAWSATAIIGVSILFAAQVLSYTRVWTSNFTFWSDVAAKVPGDALPHRELASVLLDQGRLAEAERSFERALAGKANAEGKAMTYGNLANLYRRQQRYDDAVQTLAAGLKIARHPILFHNLGMVYMARTERAHRQDDHAAVMREITQAREAFEQALERGTAPGAAETFPDWNAAKTHALLGQVLFSLGDPTRAREHLETSLRLQPTGRTADITRQYMQRLPQ